MGMTIEQIIKYLPAPICGDTVIGKEKQKEYDAHDSAVIILRKYQKIEEILDQLIDSKIRTYDAVIEIEDIVYGQAEVGMTIDEVITRYKNNAEFQRTHGNLQGCLEFRQLVKWLGQLQKIEQIANDRNINGDYLKVLEIRRVLEDGNVN